MEQVPSPRHNLQKLKPLLPPQFDRDLIECALYGVAAVSEVGQSIIQIRDSDKLSPRQKTDGTAVTEADLFARDFFQSRLPKIRPLPIFSEETAKSGEGSVAPSQWIVDELDGTSSFIRKYHNFGSLVALREAGELTIGIAGLPSLKKVLFAVKDFGAYLYDETTGNLTPLKTRSPQSDNFKIAGFFHAPDSEHAQLSRYLLVDPRAVSIHPRGALLKFCEVAMGTFDGAGGTQLMRAWDIAAPTILVREAGGEVFNLSNKHPVEITPVKENVYQVLAVGRKEYFARAAQ